MSEGTPVTPPFATREELIDHLVEGGDDWDRKRGRPGYSRESATAFVNAGWAPSFVVTVSDRMVRGVRGVEAAEALFTKPLAAEPRSKQ